MGEQDWIISQNRSVGFANNPYKFIDKGGNRVAYTEESGGSSPPQNVCKVPPSSKNVGNSSINGASIVKNGAGLKNSNQSYESISDRLFRVCPDK